MAEDWTAARIRDSEALFARRGSASGWRATRDTGELVGFCGFLQFAPPEAEPQLMYALFDRFAGLGYATEMARAAIASARQARFHADHRRGRRGQRRVAAACSRSWASRGSPPCRARSATCSGCAWTSASRPDTTSRSGSSGRWAWQPGGVLIVHTAFSKVGPVDGGPHGLIEALRAALGADGTLVMPSMCEDDEHPFDPTTFCCRCPRHRRRHLLAPARRPPQRQPARVRGGRPARRRDHPAPSGRRPARAGQPAGARPRARRPGAARRRRPRCEYERAPRRAAGGRALPPPLARDHPARRPPARIDYGENDSLLRPLRPPSTAGSRPATGKQRRGKRRPRGGAPGPLARHRRRRHRPSAPDETAFLHPFGVDAECDQARASLPS